MQDRRREVLNLLNLARVRENVLDIVDVLKSPDAQWLTTEDQRNFYVNVIQRAANDDYGKALRRANITQVFETAFPHFRI